jgi:hypothetical protein
MKQSEIIKPKIDKLENDIRSLLFLFYEDTGFVPDINISYTVTKTMVGNIVGIGDVEIKLITA